MKSKNEFLLWMFGDYDKVIITRGRTQKEAFEYASKSWRRGQTITLYDHNMINAGKLYSENHAPGWLNRKPVWLERKEQ